MARASCIDVEPVHPLDEGSSSPEGLRVVALAVHGQVRHAVVKQITSACVRSPARLCKLECAALRAAADIPVLAGWVPALFDVDWPARTLYIEYVPYPSLRCYSTRTHATNTAGLGSAHRSAMMLLGMQLLEVLGLLAEHGIAHGDVKPENVLYSPETGDFRLIDFGFALVCDTAFAPTGLIRSGTETMGSPLYASPEMLSATTVNYHVPSADCWSLGMTIFEVLCNRLPFEPEVKTIASLHEAIWRPLSLLDDPHWLAPHESACLKDVLVLHPKARANPRALAQRWYHRLREAGLV